MNRVPYDHATLLPGSGEKGKKTYAEAEAEARIIWPDFAELTRIDKFYPQIKRYASGVIRLGFIDITTVLRLRNGGVWPQKSRGIVVKVLKGQPRLEMPQQYSEKNSDFYDILIPRSLAMRICWMRFIFNDAEVRQSILDAKNAPVSEEDSKEGNTPGGSADFSTGPGAEEEASLTQSLPEEMAVEYPFSL